jgi:hypothetical protein
MIRLFALCIVACEDTGNGKNKVIPNLFRDLICMVRPCV